MQPTIPILAAAALACCGAPLLAQADASLDELLASYEAPALWIGDAAPPIEAAQWIGGEPVEGFESGTTYVIDFWATWCGPCVKAMPHLAEMKKKAGGEPFEIIAVNVSDNETAFKKYAQAHEAEYGFPLVRDPVGRSDKHNAIQSKHYGVRALPTTFVTVFGQNIGGPNPLFDPILTGVLVARFPIPSTNFAIVAMASTSLRIMFGLTFMNVNFLPIVP